MSIIRLHIHRVLQPSDDLYRHPISEDLFQYEKRMVYEKARGSEVQDLSVISTAYTGPMPHTPEFDKLGQSMKNQH